MISKNICLLIFRRMKSMKKIVLGTTILLCSVALVGCGKNTEKNKSETPTSSEVKKSSSSLESSKNKEDKTSDSKETDKKTSESTTKKKK